MTKEKETKIVETADVPARKPVEPANVPLTNDEPAYGRLNNDRNS